MLDFKQTADGDIDLGGGDLQPVETTDQHTRDLLLTAQGHYKENPGIGVDSIEYLSDNDPAGYLRAIRQQCVKDGMRVNDIYISGEDLIIDAEYENN